VAELVLVLELEREHRIVSNRGHFKAGFAPLGPMLPNRLSNFDTFMRIPEPTGRAPVSAARMDSLTTHYAQK